MSEEIDGNKVPQSGIMGIVFTAVAVIALAALVLVLVLFRSQADDASQSAVVGNAAPTVDTVTTAIASLGADQSTINPTESGNTTVYIHGTATDNNGCQDISNTGLWSTKVYRTNHASGQLCTEDKNDCYAQTSASQSGCTGAGDLNSIYEATYTMKFWGDPTDAGATQAATNWTASVTAVDASSGSGSNTDTFEYASLIALTATASLNYGTIALGADSAQQTITFGNSGNRAIDATQTASGDMVCDGAGSNNIPVGNAHISATNGFTYGTADQALTATSTAVNFSLAQRTNDATPQTTNWYGKLRMPSTGVRGTCTNTVTFTAGADA